ncbi:MAG: metalloregulator ArsR/SmtB family transcription factor [Slackia sp.]|nr:metalloregulator ArsR/SmtB family transcription factor [Slackia sp.]
MNGEERREQIEKAAALFKVLSNEKRLSIVCALLDGPRTVGDIAEHVPGISLPGISQHLSALRAAGILSAEKHGQYVVYALSDKRISTLLETVRREFCEEGADRSASEA